MEVPKKRRTKSDSEGRTFSCGCGKKYLSYPALYTHIKTKHEGVKPQIKEIKLPSCNEAIEEFFKEKGQLSEHETVITHLKNCINLRGYQMDKETSDQEYCSAKTPDNIPNIINFFLLKYLPYELENFDLEKYSDIAQEFCKWLHEKKYTKKYLKLYRKNSDNS